MARDDVEISLSDNLEILSGKLINKFISMENGNETINKIIIKSSKSSLEPLKDDELYFQYKMSGYVSEQQGSIIVTDFMDEIRIFYGLCIAHYIISDWEFYNTTISIPIIVNKFDKSNHELVYVGYTDSDLSKATNLATSVRHFDEPIRDQTDTLDGILSKISKAYRSDNSSKLKTAALWLFRATISQRKIDQILESTIALEVLLGDRDTSDRIGLSKLMANRAAYALSRSAKEREKIMNFFNAFYKVRSEIVHVGKFKLSDQQEAVVEEGLSLAKRMLVHETRIG